MLISELNISSEAHIWLKAQKLSTVGEVLAFYNNIFGCDQELSTNCYLYSREILDELVRLDLWTNRYTYTHLPTKHLDLETDCLRLLYGIGIWTVEEVIYLMEYAYTGGLIGAMSEARWYKFRYKIAAALRKIGVWSQCAETSNGN